MKKIFSVFAFLMSLSISLVSCQGDTEPVGHPGELYYIDIDVNGGEPLKNSTIGVIYGQHYTIPFPKRVGYIFGGWLRDGKPFTNDGIWEIGEDITVKAVWQAKSYKIFYSCPGGGHFEQMPQEDVFYDGELILQYPWREDGTKFLGWFTSDGEEMKSGIWKIDANTTLYGKWDNYEYQIDREHYEEYIYNNKYGEYTPTSNSTYHSSFYKGYQYGSYFIYFDDGNIKIKDTSITANPKEYVYELVSEEKPYMFNKYEKTTEGWIKYNNQIAFNAIKEQYLIDLYYVASLHIDYGSILFDGIDHYIVGGGGNRIVHFYFKDNNLLHYYYKSDTYTMNIIRTADVYISDVGNTVVEIPTDYIISD